MKNEKTINTPQLAIAGNIMAWNDSVIQLSNISSISTVPLALTPFPLWIILLLFGGISSFMYSKIMAIVIIVIGLVAIIGWNQKNEEIKQQKNLIILMNSGITFSFLFRDKKFLNEVFGVLSSIIAEHGKEERHVKININNSTISGNAKILNDMFLS